MALTADDLLQPKGPVSMVLFPGQQGNVVSDMLDEYLDAAYNDARVAAQTNPIKDALARAWSLYLVFDNVCIRMSAEPITVTVDGKGSHGYSREQIQAMERLRDKYLSDFNGMLLTPGAQPPSNLPGSYSVNNRVVF